MLAGPAGDLETLIETPHAAATQAFGVICHPHPLFSGTLQNKVVHTLARSFQELGAPTLRFNFRGVGASAGRYADGVGETEDALAVVAAGRARWPGASVWLAGFSFGGAVAFRAAARAGARLLVTVAPGVTLVDTAGVEVPDCPWLIVQGDADDVVEPRSVLDWAQALRPAPVVKSMPGVGHFFHGRLRELQTLVVDFVHERGLARE
ncbi:MAG TPA: alpha/beta fold hydrolase [Steroidobacteraceae bacterium]|jgi:alpha/beta superfamily hydrolase|nr:alpha/beta fold hydrolase [Steroidobacteraceae bacterium]